MAGAPFYRGDLRAGHPIGVALLAAVAILTVTVSSFISRAPALGILTPVVLNVALDSGTSVLAMGFVTAMSSAFTYMTVKSDRRPTPSSSAADIFSLATIYEPEFALTWALLILLLVLSQTYWRLLLPI